MTDKPWHSFPKDQLFAELGSQKEGLSLEDHKQRLVKYGPNKLPLPEKPPHWVFKFVLSFFGLFQFLLLFFFVLSLICLFFLSKDFSFPTLCYNLGGMFLALLLAALFKKEFKTNSTLSDLPNMEPKVSVFRDQKLMDVDVSSLVPGDICQLKEQQTIPADIRILSSDHLKVNMASLTGEAEDIPLNDQEEFDIDAYAAKNIARAGCLVTSGKGVGVVFATGSKTLVGGISQLIPDDEHSEEPPESNSRKVKKCIQRIALVDALLGFLIFSFSWINGNSLADSIFAMIFSTLTVVNVSEKLFRQLPSVWIEIAKSLMTKEILPKVFDDLEKLGEVNAICFDKTGVLTTNSLTVRTIVYNDKIHSVDQIDKSDRTFLALQRIATFTAEAEFISHEEDVMKRKMKGSASDCALLRFLQPLRDIKEFHEKCPKVFQMPFAARNKWSCSINEQENHRLQVSFKGAAERILSMCKYNSSNGEILSMTEENKSLIMKNIEKLGETGQRVLAFAQSELDETFNKNFKFSSNEINFPIETLCFIGLIGVSDPPRASSKKLIQECKDSNIDVYMLTGDHYITARTIARSVGILSDNEEKQIIFQTGSEIDNYEFLDSKNEVVVARATPESKMQFVQALTERGKNVAMVGDGTNDVPAMCKSNVGVAMACGTEMALKAAHFILVNDDLGGLMEGIKEARFLMERIQKIIYSAFFNNILELIPLSLLMIWKIPFGVEISAILWLDVVLDLSPIQCLIFGKPMKMNKSEKPIRLLGLKLVALANLLRQLLKNYVSESYFGGGVLVAILVIRIGNLVLNRIR